MSSILNSPQLTKYKVKAQAMFDVGNYSGLMEWMQGRLCACLGPRNDDPACQCRMRNAAAREVVAFVKLRKLLKEPDSHERNHPL